MKNIILSIAFTFFSLNSFAAETLKCKSSDGSTLKWTEAYGELVVKGPKGETITNEDACHLGKSRHNGNKITTDIVYGGEGEYEVVAKLVRNGSKTSIVFDSVSYLCE